MNKNYTLIYLLENFESKSDDLFDVSFETEEFKDIFELLNKFEAEPSQRTIDKILSFSRSYEA